MVALGTLVLSGCGRREVPPPPRPAPPVVKMPEIPALTAADYMALESSRSLLVVRSSELALTRSADGRIRGIAERLKGDHTGIAAQLNMAGRRLNLLPSASLLPLDQTQLDGLSRASDFEVAYLRTMKAAVENCANAHASYADKGNSPTLRPVARFAASTCRDELRSL
jgi:putative membrane protein